jgi:hypothetical protein
MLHSFTTIKSTLVTLLFTVSISSFATTPASPVSPASPASAASPVSSVSPAAPAEGINTRVQTAFRKDFNKAELIGFEVGRDHTKLTLKINDVIMYAFYSDNGNLLAVTRNIRSSQLPIPLLMELKNKYSNYWISDLFELIVDDQSNYYITVENDNSKLTLRSSDNNSWEKYEKTNKE